MFKANISVLHAFCIMFLVFEQYFIILSVKQPAFCLPLCLFRGGHFVNVPLSRLPPFSR